MSALEARDVTIEVAGAPVVEGLTLTVAAGDKLGVVGRNGAEDDGLADFRVIEFRASQKADDIQHRIEAS